MVKESIPKEGENIKIQSYKHDGNIHRVWSETTILKGTDHVIIGGNDHTLVTESDGRTWITREPAIVYFHSEYWFNVICMFREDGIYYYCNLSSPFVCDEYEQHMKQMNYPHEIDVILRRNVDILQQWIEQKKGPFAPDFIKVWKQRYKKIRNY